MKSVVRKTYVENFYDTFREMPELVRRESALFFNGGKWNDQSGIEGDAGIVLGHIRTKNFEFIIFDEYISIISNSTARRLVRVTRETLSKLIADIDNGEFRGEKIINGINGAEVKNPSLNWDLQIRCRGRMSIELGVSSTSMDKDKEYTTIPKHVLRALVKVRKSYLRNSEW